MSYAVQSYALHSRVVDDLNNLNKLDNLWIKSNKPMYKDSSCQSLLDNPMSLELINIADIRVLVPVTITVTDIEGNEIYVATPILIDDFNVAQDGDQTVIWDDVQNKPAFTGWATKAYSNGSTTDVAEGTQLYYTDARSDSRITLQKGAISGITPLGADSKIPLIYLPVSITGQVHYNGTWNASTNIPTIPTASTDKGGYYIVSVAGTYNTIDYQIGDWIISDGTAWGKVDNTDSISTWNGRTGLVTPIKSDYSAWFVDLASTYNDPSWITNLDAGKIITNTVQRFVRDVDINSWNSRAGTVFGRSGDIVAQSSDYSGFYPLLVNGYSDPSWIASLNATKLILDSTHRLVTDTEKSTWNAKQSAITTGTNLQYLRGDLSLATFPTTWAWNALTGIPTGVAQLGNPTEHGNLRLGTTIVGGWHGIEAQDPNKTRILLNDVPGNNKVGFYGLDTAKTGNVWYVSFNRDSVMVDGWVPWSRLTGIPTTLGGYGITDAATSTHSHPFYVQGQNSSRTTEWTANSPFSAINYSGFFNSALAPDSPTPNTWAHLIHSDYTGNDDWSFDIAANFINNNTENYFMRVKHGVYETTTTGNGWRKLWHDGNLAFNDLIGNASYQGFYSTNVTKSATNYAIVWNKDGTTTLLNGTIGVYINISDSNKFNISNALATFNVPIQGTTVRLSSLLELNSPTVNDTFNAGPCTQFWDNGSNAWGLKLQNSASAGGAKHFGIHWYGNINGTGMGWNWVGSFARNTPSGQPANSGGIFDYAGASMGSWVGSGWTWFGRSGFNENAWSGFMQDANGKTILGSKSGQPVQLCVAQTRILEANSTGIDVVGTGTFSGIAQATKFRATDYTSSYANLILATGATNSYTGIVSTAGAITPTMQFAQVTTNGAFVRNAHIIAANGQFNGVTLRYYTADGTTDYTDYAGMYSNGVAWHSNTFSFLTHTTNIASYINAKTSIELQLTATDLSKRVSVISAQRDRIDFNSFTHNNGSLVQGLAMVQSASGLVGLYVRDIYGTTPTWGTVGIQWYTGDAGSEVNLVASKGSLSASASWTTYGFNIDKGMYVKTFTKTSSATTAATATVLSDGFNMCNPTSSNCKYALPGAVEGRVIRVHIPGGGPVSATVYGGTDGTTLISKQDGTSATSWTFSGGYTFVAYNNSWWVV